MKLLNKKNNSGYSVVISLFIIGFLLVFTSGIFNLVLKEMKDNRAMGDYIKAYAGAESARELALLKIKENGYGYYEKIEHEITDYSIIMSQNPTDKSKFINSKDVFISYDIGSKVSDYEGILEPIGHDIIPLFYINELGEQKATKIEFSILTGDDSKLAWNVIGKNNGISGNGNISIGIKKTLTSNGFVYSEESVNNFLDSSDSNYLHLFNTGNFGEIKYKIKTLNSNESFSSPETTIISSAEVGKYKQNLRTELDNTEFLNILKYSIYSN